MKTFSLFEYLLIISPSQEIKRFVWHLKRIFADRYKCTTAARSVPHITMGNWKRSDHDEARIIARIYGFAETISPFIAHFDSLGCFKTETIFVNVLNKEPFAEIRKRLIDSTLLNNDVTFPSVPHLTVAKSMEAAQFESAWNEWKDEKFKASCEVNGMILLRKSVGKERDKYQTITIFPFRGKTPPIKQLALDF